MKIGDRIYVRGYIDEIRKDTVIVRNDGGYFGTIPSEVITGELPSAQPDVPDINDGDIISRQAVQEMIDRIGGMYPYRQIGNRDSYSQYNEAWTDAINRVDAELNSLPSVQPEAKPPKWVAEDRYVKNRFAVFPHCPRCNAGITTGQCYCMICGQHIDWSEDDG